MPLRFSTLYRKTKPPVEISLILGLGGGIPSRPSERQRPSPPPCSSEQSNTKKFSFPFTCPSKPRRRRGRKNRSRANREKQRKLFCGACRFPARRRGGFIGGFAQSRFVQGSEISPFLKKKRKL